VFSVQRSPVSPLATSCQALHLSPGPTFHTSLDLQLSSAVDPLPPSTLLPPVPSAAARPPPPAFYAVHPERDYRRYSPLSAVIIFIQPYR